MHRLTLSNGTIVEIDDNRETLIVLPDGRRIEGCPQGDPGRPDPGQVATARELGYGGDDAEAVAAMVADHDPLHAILADMIGLPISPALAGGDPRLAALDEAATLAVQRYMVAAGGRLLGSG